MALVSRHDRNLNKSERRLEGASRLVHHPENLTPMSNGGGTETRIRLRSWGQEHDHQKSHRSSHSLSEVRTDRNSAVLHAAEIVVASQRAAEIE